jgi:hypothetical protein
MRARGLDNLVVCGLLRTPGRDLREALAETSPPDARFETDIAEALKLLTTDGTDPWVDA